MPIDSDESQFLPMRHPWNGGYAIPEYMLEESLAQGPTIRMGEPRGFVLGPAAQDRPIFAPRRMRGGVDLGCDCAPTGLGWAIYPRAAQTKVVAAVRAGWLPKSLGMAISIFHGHMGRHAQARTARKKAELNVASILGSMRHYAVALQNARSFHEREAVQKQFSALRPQLLKASESAIHAMAEEVKAHVLTNHAGAKMAIAAMPIPAQLKPILQKMIDEQTATFQQQYEQAMSAQPAASGLGLSFHPMRAIHHAMHKVEQAARGVAHGASAAFHSRAFRAIEHGVADAGKLVAKGIEDVGKELYKLAKEGLCKLGEHPELIKAGIAAGAAALGAPPSMTMPSIGGAMGGAGGSLPSAAQIQQFLPPGTSLPAMPSGGAGGGSMPTSQAVNMAGNMAASAFKKACPKPPPQVAAPILAVTQPSGGGGGGSMPTSQAVNSGGGGGAVAMIGALAAAALLL